MNTQTENGSTAPPGTEPLPSTTAPATPAPPWRSDWMADIQPFDSPVDGAALLDDLCGIMQRFVVLPKWGAETLALWTLHTYAFQLRDVCAYLGIESPEKRCGKTTLLAVLTRLVHRPVIAANISSSAFFRVIEELQPTLLIDEADTLLRGNDELRGILNAGCGRQTAYVVRVAMPALEHKPQPPPDRRPGSPSRLARYSCWCPKAIAAIGRLPETLADRCIRIRMQRKSFTESCERLRHLETTDLRRRCVRFISDQRDNIANAMPEVPGELDDRAADTWEPLLALADAAGGAWPDRARDAAFGLMDQEQPENFIGSLLEDIFTLFIMDGGDRIMSRHLVERLNILEQDGRPWREFARGQTLDQQWLARQLRPYGICPLDMRIGEQRGKGYRRSDFRDAFQRYIPPDTFTALLRIFREEIKAGHAKAATENPPAPSDAITEPLQTGSEPPPQVFRESGDGATPLPPNQSP